MGVRRRLVPVVSVVSAVALLATVWASGIAPGTARAMAGIMRIDGAATVSEQAERVPGSFSGPLPAEAQPVDTSDPDRVIGNGNPASCTSAAVVAAVAAGGVITFDCGPDPITIVMTATAKVVNTSPRVVVDGGGLVTLSGADQRRILYMNTCDRNQTWTTSHCQNQEQPQLTIQRIGFTRGNSTGSTVDGGGGGAVFVRGGQVSVIDATFTANRCESSGPDIGGGALRVLSQFEGRPVIVASSTFGGGGADGNQCSNGGALSSIGVSWRIYDSDFIANRATGVGANPQRPGTPGGGNGGSIALDGNTYTLELLGSRIRDSVANEGGGSIFFVSNNRTGHLRIADSTLSGNVSLGFETRELPGIFYLGDGPAQVTNSTLG